MSNRGFVICTIIIALFSTTFATGNISCGMFNIILPVVVFLLFFWIKSKFPDDLISIILSYVAIIGTFVYIVLASELFFTYLTSVAVLIIANVLYENDINLLPHFTFYNYTPVKPFI